MSRILLIDDDVRLSRIVSAFFETEGYEVVWVSSGQDALTRVADERWDLIILDIGLGDVNGVDLCRQLRLTPANIAIPILVFSARSEAAIVEAARAAGATRFITKPYTLEGLGTVVASYLKESKGP